MTKRVGDIPKGFVVLLDWHPLDGVAYLANSGAITTKKEAETWCEDLRRWHPKARVISTASLRTGAVKYFEVSGE